MEIKKFSPQAQVQAQAQTEEVSNSS